MKHAFIETSSGKLVDILHPKAEDIDINDIAHALANQCRYGGHSKFRYSVAEHSVKVAQFVRHHHVDTQGCNEKAVLVFAALMHDASEGLLVDLPTPVKKDDEFYLATEKVIMNVIFKKYDIPFAFEDLPEEILTADHQLLYNEAKYLLVSGGKNFADWDNYHEKVHYHKDYAPNGWNPKRAERLFLRAFDRDYHDMMRCMGFGK